MESLTQLRDICQKPDYRKVGNWMARYITRDMALPITWLLLHTPLRADSVGLISLACGLVGAFFLSLPAVWAFFAGTLLLQLWYLLDHVDGQMARYYKEADLTGNFFDYMIHFFVHSAAAFALGLRMYLGGASEIWLYAGFLAALAMGGLSQFNDCKYKAFFSGLMQWAGKSVRVGGGAEAVKDIKDNGEEQVGLKNRAIAQAGFIFLYKLTEIHVFINLLGLAAIAEIAGWPGAHVFIRFYVLLLPFVLTMRMLHIIRNHRIDADFAKHFSKAD